MTTYRTATFRARLELDDGEEVVGVDLNSAPNAQNIALVKEADSDDTYYCGVETDSGECGREVDGPDDTCWQHEE